MSNKIYGRPDHHCEHCGRLIRKLLGNWVHNDTGHSRCHPNWQARPKAT